MDRISAAGNLSIYIEPNRWRLSAAANGDERLLVEAAAGESLRYTNPFAEKRRLPGGTLAIAQIQRVVTGWSREDQSWHLGLLFEASLAESRGSRWCELARWPDPDTSVFADVADQAGRALARILARPYNLIEPETISKSAPAPSLPPLRALPLEFDQWTLEQKPNLQFKRSSRWARARIIRLAWYGLLLLAYVALSVLSLQGIIALPRPEFLPYLGLATAVLLFGLMIYTLYQLVTQPSQILVESHGVRARHASGHNWQINRNDVQAVYVSEVVNKKGKKRVIYHGELNLYLHDGKFRTFLEQPHTIEDGIAPTDAPPEDEVVLLTPHNAHTDLQVAGLHVANALKVECRYDRRVK